MAKNERDDSLRTVVVRLADLPKGCVPLVEYHDQPLVGKRTPYKFLYDLAYRGKFPVWALYLNGRANSKAPLFVLKAEADRAVEEHRVETEKKSTEKAAAPALKPTAVAEKKPYAPVMNDRLVLALESIAGSLEMIAEVAVDHAPPAPPVIRQPSMNGHADKIPPY